LIQYFTKIRWFNNKTIFAWVFKMRFELRLLNNYLYFCFMRISRSLLRIFSFTILLMASWFIFQFAKTILSEVQNENLDFVPSNATFVMRIDGRQLAETTLFSIVMKSKDEEIIRLLERTFKNKVTDNKEFKNVGINFLSDVVVFKLNYKEGAVTGILVNLFNKRLFDKNISSSNDIQQVISSTKNVGLILSYTAKKNEKISSQELQKFADSILHNKQNLSVQQFISNREEGKFTEVYIKGNFLGNNLHSSESSIVFEQKEQSFLLHGNIEMNHPDNDSHELSHQLAEKGFHVTSRSFSKELSDTLSRLLSFIDKPIPEISAFSLNYNGTKIINHTSGFFFIPDMELVVQCANPFAFESFLKESSISEELDCQITGKTIQFQNEILYYKQLTSKSFYIGSIEHPTFANRNINELLHVSGKLDPLLNIQGGGMMTAFLEMIPVFKASKGMANHSEKIQFDIIEKDRNKAEIKGELIFKKEYYPMNEIIKFLLISQMAN